MIIKIVVLIISNNYYMTLLSVVNLFVIWLLINQTWLTRMQWTEQMHDGILMWSWDKKKREYNN